MTLDRIMCPRCGESLPATLSVCDACGFDLGARVASVPPSGPSQHAHVARGPKSRGPAAARDSRAVPGIAWLLLVVGLAVGGMVGFALHSAVGPRAETDMPTGPADVMAGGSGGDAPAAGGVDGGGMGGGGMGGGGRPQQMPGQIMQMVQGYKAALAKNPKDLDATIGLGNLEFDSGQWDHAIDYYTRALSIDPKNADVRVDRAIAYHASGKNDVAVKELRQVTRERPDHKNAWLNLGVVSHELGDRAGALRAWQRYLELDPQGEHAASVRQEIESLKQAG
jgi:tetratricopeptide repeat protein